MKRLLLVAPLAALVAACTTTAPPPKPAPPKLAPAGHGAWAFVPASRAEAAKLGYGVPGTDSVGLMLMCARPQVRIILYPPDGTPAARIELRSGKAHGAYPLAPPKEADGMPSLEGRMAAADPVLDAFAATGQLTQTVGRDARTLDARAAQERAAVRAFRGACPAKGG